MTLLAAGKVNYRARIERAAVLAGRSEFAAKEVLTFYVHLAEFQKSYYEKLPKLWGKRAVVPANGDLRAEFRLEVVLETFDKLLDVVERHGPGVLADAARGMRSKGYARQGEILQENWKTGLLERELLDTDEGKRRSLGIFFARVMLQPYAEFVAGAMLPPVPLMTVCRCPRCNALPLLGVLRPEGDGGKRFLVCSFCSLEWEFRRILCAKCGEENERKLPVYVAEQVPHIRMECCETCKHFLRTVDLTKDGHAVPLVDDLAAVPLSLWGEENGFQRIQRNLLGT
jgi:formate dehydrogenase maturation protein FdhE